MERDDSTTDTDLATLRRKLKFRAWHRGIKEMDLVLGGFVDQSLDHLSANELEEFSAILKLPDQDLFAWVSGRKPIPDHLDTPLLRRIFATKLASNNDVTPDGD